MHTDYNVVENTVERQQQQKQEQNDTSNENNTSLTNSMANTLNDSNLLSIDKNTKQTTVTNTNSNTSPHIIEITKRTEQISLNKTYQNNDFSYVNTDYTNRETMLFDASLQQQYQQQTNLLVEHESLSPKQNDNKIKDVPQSATSLTSSNLIDRSQSFKDITNQNDLITGSPSSFAIESGATLIPIHTRAK